MSVVILSTEKITYIGIVVLCIQCMALVIAVISAVWICWCRDVLIRLYKCVCSHCILIDQLSETNLFEWWVFSFVCFFKKNYEK